MAQARLGWIDTLRGVAILLMILDHIACYLMGVTQIEGVRYLTRLSMPLFVFVMGYLLARGKDRVQQRAADVLAFALMVVPFDLAVGSSLNILFPIAGALIAATVLSPEILIASVFLQPFDLTRAFFQYGLLSVAFIAGIGYLYRNGRKMEMVPALLLGTVVAFLNPLHISYELIALPFAVLLFVLFERYKINLPLIETIGRYPLAVYLLHLYIILAIRLIILG